jgi:hypothetical protein
MCKYCDSDLIYFNEETHMICCCECGRWFIESESAE